MSVEIANYRNIPQSSEIEFCLLCTLLFRNDKYSHISDIVCPEYFYNPLHGLLYEAIGKMINGGMVADPLTLMDFMKNDPRFANNNGEDYLLSIAQNGIIAVDIEQYAEQIRDFYIRRQYMDFFDQGINEVQKPLINLSNEDLSVLMGQKMTAIESIKDNSEQLSVGNAFDLCVHGLEEDMRNKEIGKTSRLLTGISAVDNIAGGFTGGQLITVGAGTRIGKSVFALTVAVNAAKAGKEVLFCSLEMSKDDLMKRLIARETGIPTHLLKGDLITPQQLNKIVSIKHQIKSLPITLSDDGLVSIYKLRSKALKKKRTSGLDLIIVDYLQQMIPAQSKEMNRHLEVSKISRGLKMLAKELNVPVISLSQLSREVDKRQGNKPRLSDLRESGTIEQDSDIVLLLFREFEYLKNEAPEKGSKEYYLHVEKIAAIENNADIEIAKNRNGITGVARVRYDKTRLVFEDHPIGKGE